MTRSKRNHRRPCASHIAYAGSVCRLALWEKQNIFQSIQMWKIVKLFWWTNASNSSSSPIDLYRLTLHFTAAAVLCRWLDFTAFLVTCLMCISNGWDNSYKRSRPPYSNSSYVHILTCTKRFCFYFASQPISNSNNSSIVIWYNLCVVLSLSLSPSISVPLFVSFFLSRCCFVFVTYCCCLC